MKITDEMVSAAKAANSELEEATIRSVLTAAMDGQVVFAVDEGEVVSDGKSSWPSYGVVVVREPLKALDLGQQLIAGASQALHKGEEQCHIQLLLAGSSIIEHDD